MSNIEWPGQTPWDDLGEASCPRRLESSASEIGTPSQTQCESPGWANKSLPSPSSAKVPPMPAPWTPTVLHSLAQASQQGR